MQRRRSLAGLFALLIVAALSVQAAAWNAAVSAEINAVAAADASLPLEDRLGHARTAARLQPSVVAYRQQEAALVAQRAFEAGDLDGARQVLIAAWGLDRSNTALREQLRAVNLALVARDSRKAHVLHGREKPGGVLEPEDLLP